jgi:sensor c-di-GMP phosphodiesterase-like protein
MNYFKVSLIALLFSYAASAYCQEIKAEQLLGNWDLTIYELKGKDKQMTLLFDNSNVDSSFNVLVQKMANDLNSSQNNIPADSLVLLKKQYIQQVKYLSKSYFKFSPHGKCKHNLINDKQKFKTIDDTYTVQDNTILLGDGSKYKIISLQGNKLIIHSNSGKIQLTYTKQ